MFVMSVKGEVVFFWVGFFRVTNPSFKNASVHLWKEECVISSLNRPWPPFKSFSKILWGANEDDIADRLEPEGSRINASWIKCDSVVSAPTMTNSVFAHWQFILGYFCMWLRAATDCDKFNMTLKYKQVLRGQI